MPAICRLLSEVVVQEGADSLGEQVALAAAHSAAGGRTLAGDVRADRTLLGLLGRDERLELLAVGLDLLERRPAQRVRGDAGRLSDLCLPRGDLLAGLVLRDLLLELRQPLGCLLLR